MKIALIGSEDFCMRTDMLISGRTDIELEMYRYKDPQEATQLISLMKPCDVIFFSGSLPYTYAQKMIESLPIPSIYLKQDETAVAVTLLHLATQQGFDLKRISFDVAHRSIVDHVINDLERLNEIPYVHVLQDNYSLLDVTSFHKELSILGKTDIAITSVHAVYEQLMLIGIPAIKMIDPESSILQSLELAKQQAILHKSNSAQIAVGIIHKSASHFDIESFVVQLASFLQAHWSKEEDVFTVYTTFGNIESTLKNVSFQKSFQAASPNIKLAFGSGETIVDATKNAEFALEFIKKNTDSSFYILDSSKRLRGPFPQSTEVVNLNVNDPILFEISEKTKLGPANISKLLQFSLSRHAKQFTANDLALHLNVTRRTAERTLKKLLDCNYAYIVGEEMTYRQGRPRALYEFNFPIYS